MKNIAECSKYHTHNVWLLYLVSHSYVHLKKIYEHFLEKQKHQDIWEILKLMTFTEEWGGWKETRQVDDGIS